MKLGLMTSKMAILVLFSSMALSLFVGASPSVQAEVATSVSDDAKAVHITNVGGLPLYWTIKVTFGAHPFHRAHIGWI